MKKAAVVFWSVCMAAALAGCGSSSKHSMDTAVSVSKQEMATNGSASLWSDYGYAESIEKEMDIMDSAGTEAGVIAGQVTVDERKLIKTVDMNVETRKFDELMSSIQSQVKTLGGYIESMNTYNGSSYSGYRATRNADLTLRIPKAKLDTFLNAVSEACNVVRCSENVEDVTLTYVDLESHKEALGTQQSRLLELLEKAESIEDIIVIEQRLSEVRYQLESMESQLRTYDNQVDYSTVYLTVDEVEIYTPVEKETAWERISAGFMESLDNIGNGFVEFGIWFVIHIPYLALWAVFVTVFVLFVLWLIRHSTKQPQSKSEKEQEKV